MTTPPAEPTDLEIPAVSKMLKAAHRQSGLTVADLAAATGLSLGTIHNALSGIRYRDGQARVTVPPDRTLVKLCSVLGIAPRVLRLHERDRAAELLTEAQETEPQKERITFGSEREAQAAAAARAALAARVLSAFSADELRAEVDRRDQAEHAAIDTRVEAELTEDLMTDRWPL